MLRFLSAFLCALAISGFVGADDKADAKVEIPEALKDHQNEVDAIRKYFTQEFQAVFQLINTKPDEAEKKIEALEKIADAVEPTEDAPKQLLGSAKAQLKFFRQQLELAKVTIEELEKKLDENGEDSEALDKYMRKSLQEISNLSRAKPDEAASRMENVRARLDKIREAAKNPIIPKKIELMGRQFSQIEKSIAAAKKLTELIGKDAAPLEIESWVNGTPLKDAELKGKVVLLDFWAVWCGPCIATFPHLIEWNEKYSEKGLVIIGLTEYYNYKWDEDAGKASRSQEKVATEVEQKMLEKFAEQHKLKHRIAIKPKDSTLDEFYGVTGIPHVVLVDQVGKIRIIRVGSGGKNAEDIEEMIQKLLAEPPTAAGG